MLHKVNFLNVSTHQGTENVAPMSKIFWLANLGNHWTNIQFLSSTSTWGDSMRVVLRLRVTTARLTVLIVTPALTLRPVRLQMCSIVCDYLTPKYFV